MYNLFLHNLFTRRLLNGLFGAIIEYPATAITHVGAL